MNIKASDIQKIAFFTADGVALFFPAAAPVILLAEKLILELEKSGAIKLEPSEEEIAKKVAQAHAAGKAAKASSDATSAKAHK